MVANRSGTRRTHVIILAIVSGWLAALACGGDGQEDGLGGSGGTTVSSGGGALGGTTTGGDRSGTGGAGTTGGSSGGGQYTGGFSSGGASTGGMVLGGTGTGGMVTGGVGAGGIATGGTGTGGIATGGVGTGGMATGGAGAGGTGGSTCVPYHYPGTDCASCHGAACTCETQTTSCYIGICASPGTPIATPAGARPIESLAVGNLVFSVDRGEVVAVPVRKVGQARTGLGHTVVRVVLATGSVLEISAPHPTGDGRVFGDLRPGERLGGEKIVRVETVPYRHEFTYDILPASDSGTYFAGGVLIGSTLAELPDAVMWDSAGPLTLRSMLSASCEERCKKRWAFDGW